MKHLSCLPLCLFTCLCACLFAGCAVSPSPQSATAPRSMALTAGKPTQQTQQDLDYRTNYRQAAARHIYQHNRERIYSGVMPHHLHAVAVLEIRLDAEGRLIALHWLRAPSHAPEVIAEIERTVRQAAPFPALLQASASASATPAPPGMSYVDTWLWHASGQFQLHTLTEGQGDMNAR